MLEDLRELWKYRELLLIFVQRDLKVRYKNSILGVGWSLLNPLVQVATITAVLQFLVADKSELPQNYHAYVFCATLPWLFFSTTLADSTNSLIYYHGIIRKTYFPREILPIATIVANMLHFLLALGVFVLYETANPLFFWFRGRGWDCPLLPTALLLPIPMLGLALLVTGCAMFVSVWTLYFEDMRYIVDSSIKILYWGVPVVYFAEAILHRVHNQTLGRLLYRIYMLDPLAGFITAFRKLALVPTKIVTETGVARGPGMTHTDWIALAAAWVSALLVLWLGHRFFTARKWTLAERG